MKRVVVLQEAGPFAENQDVARRISGSILKDAITHGERVVIDFSGVEEVTQSFVHALLSEAIRTCGKDVIGRIHFRGRGPEIRAIILAVVKSLSPAPDGGRVVEGPWRIFEDDEESP